MKVDSAGWPLLLASFAALVALQLWLRPLLPVDETRYLSVAWEMWWRGDFLVPHLNAEPYSHKPPLLFWLIHAAWSVAGVSELAARLIPCLLGVAVLWLSARLAGRLWPEQAGALRGLVPWLLLGGVFWINFVTLLQFDLLLVLTALLAWNGILHAVRSAVSGWLLVGVAVGLGVLAKGPVILVPVLPAIVFAPWWAGSHRPASWPCWYGGGLTAVLVGAGIALCWAIPAAGAGGEAYREAIFWGQSAGRLVDSFAHRNPWWSYLLWLPLMWLPWLLWPRVWQALRRMRMDDTGLRFCVSVIGSGLLVFSVISGKQGKYLLPLFPLIGMLFAYGLLLHERQSRVYRLAFVAVPLLLSAVVLLALPAVAAGPAWFARVEPLWGLVLLAGGGVLALLKVDLMWAVRAGALGMMLWTASLYLAVVPLLAPQYDLGAFSRTLSGLQAAGRQLAWLGKYHGQFHFLGRLQERIEPLPDRRRLHAWLQSNPDGYLLVNYKTVAPDVPDAVPVRPYRGGSLVLWPAADLLSDPQRLDALTGSA